MAIKMTVEEFNNITLTEIIWKTEIDEDGYIEEESLRNNLNGYFSNDTKEEIVDAFTKNLEDGEVG